MSATDTFFLALVVASFVTLGVVLAYANNITSGLR
jgi:hypothetical protein